jgi:hypothetical protein
MTAGRSSRTEAAMLSSLAAHRLLTARQLRVLNAPQAGTRWTEKTMARLVAAGLVGFVNAGGSRRVYYLTADGHRAVGSPARLQHADAGLAAGPLRAHTLAVNDVGLAFLQAARERDDEFGPEGWRHEVAHSIGQPAPGRRTELVIADAVLTYLQHLDDGGLAFHYRFLELDRATQPTADLATKLSRYARLFAYTTNKHKEPLWHQTYPVFPEVLVVLTGTPGPAALRRRAETVLALCQNDRLLQRTPQVAISIVLFDDLLEQGPWAPIFQRLNSDRPTTWTGATA